LVTAQVVFSFLLLAGAGLFVKTLANLRQTNTGFRDLSNLITFAVDPSLSGYDGPRMRDFYRKALDAVRALPGVETASWAENPVLAGNEWDSTLSVEGHRPKDGEDMQAFMNAVSPGYFKSMGTPILAGRDFEERYAGHGWRYAIVNRAFATHFFGNETPIGKHVAFGDHPRNGLNIEIIGMVENALYEGPREGVHRQAFVPGFQDPFIGRGTFYVRTSVNSATMFSAVRRKIHELDSAMPLYDMKTLDTQLDEALATERLIALLSAGFGGVATLLAALGLYGVMAFAVARRTREIGLRMALGASQQSVLWMVLRESLSLLAVGLALGLPAAYVLSRFVSSQLFGVKPADVSTGLVALLILAVVAATSGFLPARRASTIDPTIALRWE
jgi:predicted permease